MLTAVLELMRVRQWIKNIFILAPLFFGAELSNLGAVSRAVIAVLVFCLASSAIYVFNDWCDIKADQQHATKKSRPLASSRLSIRVALAMMAILISLVAIIIYSARLPQEFIIAVTIYLAVNVGYSLGLKQISIVELFLVASGFVMRLIAGAFATRIVLSPWIIIATAMLALLMAVGKRRGDIAQQNDAHDARKSLASYNLAFLDSVLAALTGGTLVVYLLFCVSDYAVARFSTTVLITAIPVALGLLRYLQLVMVHGRGESPTDLVLGDRGMKAILVLFGATFAYLIYF